MGFELRGRCCVQCDLRCLNEVHLGLEKFEPFLACRVTMREILRARREARGGAILSAEIKYKWMRSKSWMKM